MTVPSSPLANALRAIRPLAAVSIHARPKTPAELLRDVTAIQRLAQDALAPPTAVPPPPVFPPPTPSPVPPAPVPPQQPPPSSGALLLLADWQYPDEAAFRASLARLGAKHPTLLSLDPSVPYQGRPSLRYEQPAGTKTTPELWPKFDAPQSDVWLRAVVRFSPGWTTKGTLAGTANSYKLLAFWWTPARAPNGTPIGGRATVEITHTTQYRVGGGAPPGVPTVNVAAEGITSEWTDGAWYDYRIHYRRLDDRTATLRHWRSKAGQPPRLVASVTLTASLAWAKVPTVAGVVVGMNANQQRVAAQSLNVGCIEVVAGGDPWSLDA